MIRQDPRFSLAGYNLTIGRVMVRDEGEYVCQVESYSDPIQQTSRLSVLTPARVSALPQSGQTVAREGSSLTLQCQAHGNPQPTIHWRKEGGLLPTGDSVMVGPAIVISAVERQHGGLYHCMADNGVGSEAVAELSVTVLHPPSIAIHRTVHTGHDRIKVQITCTVQARQISRLNIFMAKLI